MRVIDLRSDTVTKPTPAMRRAMAEAEVGDDVYAEDPTVNRLEALAAEMLGMEAGLFMPSGTMTNQVALIALAGGVIRLVEAPYGVPHPEAVRSAIHRSPHQAPTGLIELENTHNYAGGTVVPLEAQQAIQQVAEEAGLPTHLDGARLFNAAVTLKTTPAELARGFRTVSICLSKGLGAPVGSVLLMPREYRAEAWRYRKMLGGGMRQAGVLAAAGIIALTEGPKALERDHQMARALAERLLRLHVEVDLESVQTNMVYAHIPRAADFVGRLRQAGVLANAMGSRVRFVTHRDLADEDIPRALERIESALHVV